MVDSNFLPVADAIIVNQRSLQKTLSRKNGIFDATVLPRDTLIITHISFYRTFISVSNILINPEIVLASDTVQLRQIDVVSGMMSDSARAAKNIANFVFDPRPNGYDIYTESERMKNLLQKENRIERVMASSLTYQFSPSEVIGRIIEKFEYRKKIRENYTNKKKDSKKE